MKFVKLFSRGKWLKNNGMVVRINKEKIVTVYINSTFLKVSLGWGEFKNVFIYIDEDDPKNIKLEPTKEKGMGEYIIHNVGKTGNYEIKFTHPKKQIIKNYGSKKFKHEIQKKNLIIMIEDEL